MLHVSACVCVGHRKTVAEKVKAKEWENECSRQGKECMAQQKGKKRERRSFPSLSLFDRMRPEGEEAHSHTEKSTTPWLDAQLAVTRRVCDCIKAVVFLFFPWVVDAKDSSSPSLFIRQRKRKSLCCRYSLVRCLASNAQMGNASSCASLNSFVHAHLSLSTTINPLSLSLFVTPLYATIGPNTAIASDVTFSFSPLLCEYRSPVRLSIYFCVFFRYVNAANYRTARNKNRLTNVLLKKTLYKIARVDATIAATQTHHDVNAPRVQVRCGISITYTTASARTHTHRYSSLCLFINLIFSILPPASEQSRCPVYPIWGINLHNAIAAATTAQEK